MKIELIGGKKVNLEGFNVEPTFAGLLVGIPTQESKQLLIKSIKPPTQWGQRATLFKKSDLYASKNVLNPIIYSAWLSSPEPINDKEGIFDGSYLNIAWFGDDFKSNTIDKMIMDLQGFDWDIEAQNYEF